MDGACMHTWVDGQMFKWVGGWMRGWMEEGVENNQEIFLEGPR